MGYRTPDARAIVPPATDFHWFGGNRSTAVENGTEVPRDSPAGNAMD